MKEYTIVKREYGENVWDSVDALKIDTYKWVPGYEPKAEAKFCHDGENIYIHYQAWEPEITLKYTKKMQEPVFKDSCMEFFLRKPGDDRYFNFETNAAGNILLGFDRIFDDREPVCVDPAIFCFKPSVTNPADYNGEYWTLEYKIPFSFLREKYGEFDLKDGIFANVYKCGDETAHEHYGMWNEVINDEPQFHVPACFGRMWFEL